MYNSVVVCPGKNIYIKQVHNNNMHAIACERAARESDQGAKNQRTTGQTDSSRCCEIHGNFAPSDHFHGVNWLNDVVIPIARARFQIELPSVVRARHHLAVGVFDVDDVSRRERPALMGALVENSVQRSIEAE